MAEENGERSEIGKKDYVVEKTTEGRHVREARGPGLTVEDEWGSPGFNIPPRPA